MTDLNRIIILIAKDLDIPKQVIREVIMSQWNLVRDTIPTIDLGNCSTEEEFNKLKVGFNLSNLGKFYTTFRIIETVKNKQIRDAKNKKGKTTR